MSARLQEYITEHYDERPRCPNNGFTFRQMAEASSESGEAGVHAGYEELFAFLCLLKEQGVEATLRVYQQRANNMYRLELIPNPQEGEEERQRDLVIDLWRVKGIAHYKAFSDSGSLKILS